MESVEELRDESVSSALRDPATPFLFGLGFVVVIFFVVLLVRPGPDTTPGCWTEDDPRSIAWWLSWYASMLFTLVAGATYVRDRRQRYASSVDPDSRRLVSPLVWGLVAVGLVLWWLLAGSPLPFSGWRSGLRWGHLLAVVLVVPLALLFMSMMEAFVRYRVYRRRHSDVRHRTTKGIRIVSAGLMAGYLLLAIAIATSEVVVEPLPDPTWCGSTIVEST